MTNLEIIRAACVEAGVPEEEWGETGRKPKVIRLADVLLAINEKWQLAGSVSVEADGSFMQKHEAKGMADEYWGYTKNMWNLRKDSLEEQSEETLAFIADLLK